MMSGYARIPSTIGEGDASRSVGKNNRCDRSLLTCHVDEEAHILHEAFKHERPSGKVLFLLITNVLTLILCGALLNYIKTSTTPSICAQSSVPTIWSPAEDVVSFHRKTWLRGVREESPYVGDPSPAKDQLWYELTKNELIILGPSETLKLINRTDHFPEHRDAYPISLEVYHQLHCLNALRESLYPDYYNNTPGNMMKHWNHCIDNLRQAIICHGDITPITFVHDVKNNRMTPRDSITATCRNFDGIQAWASAHQKDF